MSRKLSRLPYPRLPDLADARVLVTGASGFIGANLVPALVGQGASVVAMIGPGARRSSRLAAVADGVELVSVDIRAPEELERVVAESRPDLTVHLAFGGGHPETAGERLAQLELSVLGTARLFETLASTSCARAVHVGSSLEYGDSARPMHEDDRLAPTTPRGAAKAAATLVALALSRTLGLPVLVLRPFSVYGPWEDEGRFVPVVLRAALEGTELPLTGPGIVHDFVYVGDVVDAIVRGLSASPDEDGAVVNIGSGVMTTNEELVATVGRVVGRDVRVLVGDHPTRPHDSRTWVADVDRATRVLGWKSSTPLEDGLRQTLTWLEDLAEVHR